MPLDTHQVATITAGNRQRQRTQKQLQLQCATEARHCVPLAAILFWPKRALLAKNQLAAAAPAAAATSAAVTDCTHILIIYFFNGNGEIV